MKNWTRRGFILTAGAGLTASCSGGTGSKARFKIDREVSNSLDQMYRELPFTVDLAANAAGMLVMPTVSKASFGFGGTYGEGSLLVGTAPVDYYNLISASFGFQAGVQQYSSVLFFMDSDHLQTFRSQDGWTLGADLEYTLIDTAGAAGVDNYTIKEAVYAVTFNQAGLLVGISLEGAKYSRVIR